MASGYDIELTETAEKVYLRAFEEAQECIRRDDPANSKVKHFRIIQETLDTIIPHDPFHPSRALSGALSNIFRIKKGRVRICYIGSSQRKKITVLFISDTPRKAGDRTGGQREPSRDSALQATGLRHGAGRMVCCGASSSACRVATHRDTAGTVAAGETPAPRRLHRHEIDPLPKSRIDNRRG